MSDEQLTLDKIKTHKLDLDKLESTARNLNEGLFRVRTKIYDLKTEIENLELQIELKMEGKSHRFKPSSATTLNMKENSNVR